MASHTWDLSTIYPGFDCQEFKDDINSVNNHINEITSFEMTLDFDSTADKFLNLANEILRKIYALGAFSNLVFAADTSNETAIKCLSRVEDASASLTEPFVKFTKWLGGFDFSIIEGSNNQTVMQHKFYLTTLRQEASYLLSDPEEMLLAKLQSVGSKAWNSLYSNLTSNLMVDFTIDEKTTSFNLPMIRNLANSPDKNVRKRAYETELCAYMQIDEAIARSLNSIKGEVNLVTRLRGFESPLVESAVRSHLEIDTINTMMEAINEKLPVFRKYLKRKAVLLGHSNGLPFYDLFAPITESSLIYSYEEAKEFILENFGSFSAELGDYAKTAFDNRWVDIEPRKGEMGGAFCTHIKGRKQSRILINFDGTLSAVFTLAHELGHGYHNSRIYDESMLNMNYPKPLAETASIFCETIVSKASYKNANSKEAISILEKSIERSTVVIVDIFSRFIFEMNLFKKIEDGPLSVRELNEMMVEAQREAYGDGLDYKFMHPYMWLCKSHYYSSGLSFYNYPYAFGILFGRRLYAMYEAGEPDFGIKYNKLLNSTVKMNVSDIEVMMGMDISKKSFWIKSLESIEDDIRLFLQLTSKLLKR